MDKERVRCVDCVHFYVGEGLQYSCAKLKVDMDDTTAHDESACSLYEEKRIVLKDITNG